MHHYKCKSFPLSGHCAWFNIVLLKNGLGRLRCDISLIQRLMQLFGHNSTKATLIPYHTVNHSIWAFNPSILQLQ